MVETLTLLHQSLCSWHLLFFGSCSCKGISCLSERKSRMFRMDSGIPLHRAACHHTANRWGNDSTLDENDCLLSPYRRENSLKVEMVRHLYPVVQNTDNTVHIRVNYYLENGVFCLVVWHQCKLHILILDYDWLKHNGKFSKPMISCKRMTIILHGNSEKGFSNAKKWLQGRSSGTSSTQSFSCLCY